MSRTPRSGGPSPRVLSHVALVGLSTITLAIGPAAASQPAAENPAVVDCGLPGQPACDPVVPCTPTPAPSPPTPVPAPPDIAPAPGPPGPVPSVGRARWDMEWRRPSGAVFVRWDPAPRASSYSIRIFQKGQAVPGQDKFRKVKSQWHDTANTWYHFYGLEPKATYWVEVRGENDWGIGPTFARRFKATP